MYTILYYATLSHKKWPFENLSVCYAKTDDLFMYPLNQEGAPWPKVTSNKKYLGGCFLLGGCTPDPPITILEKTPLRGYFLLGVVSPPRVWGLWWMGCSRKIENLHRICDKIVAKRETVKKSYVVGWAKAENLWQFIEKGLRSSRKCEGSPTMAMEPVQTGATSAERCMLNVQRVQTDACLIV